VGVCDYTSFGLQRTKGIINKQASRSVTLVGAGNYVSAAKCHCNKTYVDHASKTAPVYIQVVACDGQLDAL
jgi:hypothetical protein